MDRKRMRQLQSISHRTHQTKGEIQKEFVTSLAKKLAERKHRADLSLATTAKSTEGSFSAEVKYNSALGHPSEKDLMTLTAQSYPDHEINWELIDVDSDSGVITMMLEPSVEVIPVKDVKSIPPEFTSIGTAMYKRAADSSGKVNEIWTLKKTSDGLALFRSNDDLEVTAEDESGFKAGDVVNTPNGVGLIKRMDDLGNAFVQIGNKMHLVGASDLERYDTKKDLSMLQTYYEKLYGPEFSRALTRSFEEITKKSK